MRKLEMASNRISRGFLTFVLGSLDVLCVLLLRSSLALPKQILLNQ